MKPTTRGAGRVYVRGTTYWIAYYHNGDQIRESTGIRSNDPNPRQAERNRRKALAYLKTKTEQVGSERQGGPAFLTPQKRRITINELLDALEADYAARGKYGVKLVSNLRPVRAAFGTRRAIDVTGDEIDRYIAQAKQSGSLASPRQRTYKPATNATINRRLQLLGQAYRLAAKDRKISWDNIPRVTRLSEVGNARKGFFSDAEVRRVARNLSSHLHDFTLFGYLCGWRKSEIASLRWTDLDGDVVTLQAIHSKNREARQLVLVDELADIIERRKAARAIQTPAGVTTLAEYVFHDGGAPIGDFRKSWATACKLAGVEGRLFHDLRRTAVRELIRSGVHEATARKISGHKTPSMLARYNIQNTADVREALELRSARIQAQRQHAAVGTQQSARLQ